MPQFSISCTYVYTAENEICRFPGTVHMMSTLYPGTQTVIHYHVLHSSASLSFCAWCVSGCFTIIRHVPSLGPCRADHFVSEPPGSPSATVPAVCSRICTRAPWLLMSTSGTVLLVMDGSCTSHTALHTRKHARSAILHSAPNA